MGWIDKYKKQILLGAIMVVVVALIVTVTMLIFRKFKGDELDVGVKYYGFVENPVLEEYLPLEKANSMLKEKNGIALKKSAATVYVNGEYKDTETPIMNEKGQIDLAVLSKISGQDYGKNKVSAEEFSDISKKNLKVYENKLYVFLDEAEDVSVFDNYYTFEAIDMKLRKASDEDFKNALMNLPSEIKSKNTIVKYTDPDLDLGLQTEMYSSLREEKDGLIFVAGQGENDGNSTIVRVFNEYSAKTAQFMAFPGDIIGGVKVAAGYVDYNGTNRLVIATAAFNAKNGKARSVRVFDERGVLYMEVVPEFRDNAPFNILIGRFVGDTDELLVTSASFDRNGSFDYAIYSLKDGKLLKNGKSAAEKSLSKEKWKISKQGDKGIIIFACESLKACTADFSGDVKLKKLDVKLDETENGLFESAFAEGEYVATVNQNPDDSYKSFVKIYDDKNADGELLDVATYENTFFWANDSDADFEDSTYVKKANFKHIRTDVDISGMTAKTDMTTLAERPYSEWKSLVKFGSYSDSYNVWEPCFSHRWIGKLPLSKMKSQRDENGTLRYISLTKNGKNTNYEELGATSDIGTYAEGIIETDKLRIYPLRHTLENLYGYFINDAEKTVAIEPVHELEIAVGNSVGDYHPQMIEGFRSYLLGRYGTIENINAKFGTDFKSREEIDAPRDGALGDRGAWDLYKGAFFEEWSLYTRSIVNKRIAESYREALLAGFPAEIICGHSIPEGDAIEGLLGQADTRMSPVDAMMTLGTSFGATRYGIWFQDNKNFLRLANSAGFKNMTLGEYDSLEATSSTEQLNYVWSHGVKFVNILNPGGQFDFATKADIESVRKLAETDGPRPGSTGNTLYAAAVESGDRKFEVVELKHGLLKSVDENGTWTGDVYLQPFHSAIVVENFTLKKNARSGSNTAVFGDLNTGDVIEMNCNAHYNFKDENDYCRLMIEVYEDGVLNESLSDYFEFSDKDENYKFVIVNDVPLGEIKIKIRFECGDYQNVSVNEIFGSVQRESIARKYFGDFSATEHQGGVTFDVVKNKK